MIEYRDNVLLRVLTPAQIALFEPLEPTIVRTGHIIYRMDQPIEFIYFTMRVVAVSWRPMPDGGRMPVMTVPANTLGTHTLLGRAESVHEIEILLGGDREPNGWRVPRSRVIAAMRQDAELYARIEMWVHTLDHFMSQMTACRGKHDIEQRLCRKLLMIRDGLGSPYIGLSVPTLAKLLPADDGYLSGLVRRMEAQGILQRNRRGLRLIDVAEIERRACLCYSYLADHRRRALATS